MRGILLVAVVNFFTPLATVKVHDYLGCWREEQDVVKSFTPEMEIFHSTNHSSVILQCAKAAHLRGYSVFGIRNRTICVGSVHEPLTYMRYGSSTNCQNGTGGPRSKDVYSLEGNKREYPQLKEEEEKRDFIDRINQPSYDEYVADQILDELHDSLAAFNGSRRQGIPANAVNHPLIINGHVKPLLLQPLFKEIDELEFGDYKPPMDGTNILTNPSFEQPLINDPVRGWSCQGETDDPRGGVIARYTREIPKQGTFIGICLARLSEWAGPGQYIGTRVKPGRAYKFTGWTKLLDREGTGDLHSLELWLRLKKRGEKSQKDKRLARRTKYSQDNGWVRWHTAFEMPMAKSGYQYVFLFFKGPKPKVDIMLDDLYLGEIVRDIEWKRSSDILINKYRKREVQLRVNITGSYYSEDVLPNLKITVKQKSHLFAFGAAVKSKFLLRKPSYRDFYLRNFQWAVLESSLKWSRVQPTPGRFNYDDADKAVALLQAHNKLIRGHCVFWAVDTEVPYWVKSLPTFKLKAKLNQRLRSLLRRYKGRFMQWDVNNEMLHGSFFADREGSAIRDWMYKSASVADPDVDLFINDFDVVENGQLTQAFLEEAKDLLSRGIPLDGLGVQGHFTGHVDPTLLRYRLNMLSEATIPIWLTEVDVLDANPVKRADGLETVMRIAFSHPSVQGMVLWSFWSFSSWRGPDTSLVDGNDWKINAAGLRYRSLMKQWTTNINLTPSKIDKEAAYFRFRGFHGDYDVIIRLPDGQISRQEITLNPGDNRLEVLLHLPGSMARKTTAVTSSTHSASDYSTTQAPTLTPSPATLSDYDNEGDEVDNNNNNNNEEEGEGETGDSFPGEAWALWSRCDASCGDGIQTRRRICAQVSDSCDPSKVEMRSCKIGECSSQIEDPFKSSVGLYLGCFDNTNPQSRLHYRFESHPAMTPDVCVSHCSSKRFPFAGLLMASECFCGFYFNEDFEAGDTECQLPCQGDLTKNCGGQKFIAVYQTGLIEENTKIDKRTELLRAPEERDSENTDKERRSFKGDNRTYHDVKSR